MRSGPVPGTAENRLIAVNKISRDQTSGEITATDPLVTYAYDSHSRRISRTDESTETTIWYLYDGWNVVAEYTDGAESPPALSRTYTWGTDLSGTLQGAGGVGGLLAMRIHGGDHAGNYYPTFDGNGNIVEYLNDAGEVVAHYEYDPFGNNITPAGDKGDLHDLFTYRFSTKPLDSITGWYYYGYRYLDQLTGRWPSRDPIGEAGGINLYGFVGNDGVKKWDILGLRPPDFTLKNCTIIVFGGHGIGYLEGDDKPVSRNRTNASDIPYRIHTPPCSAATVISCNADRITIIDNEIPGFPPNSGSPGTTFDYGAGIFCDLIRSAIEAAKAHAVEICGKEPACCKKVKIEARILGRASCKNLVPGGYKGWVHDCESGITTEGD